MHYYNLNLTPNSYITNCYADGSKVAYASECFGSINEWWYTTTTSVPINTKEESEMYERKREEKRVYEYLYGEYLK